MTICYKLTNASGKSHGETQWGENVTHVATGNGMAFCSPDLIHLYSHPLLAVFLNPIHANFNNPLLWEAEAEIVASDNGLKLGAKRVTTLRRIPLPTVTTEQRVRFAILCALAVYEETKFKKWAEGWLANTDRTAETAWATAMSARATAEAWATAMSARARAAKPLDLVALAQQAVAE